MYNEQEDVYTQPWLPHNQRDARMTYTSHEKCIRNAFLKKMEMTCKLNSCSLNSMRIEINLQIIIIITTTIFLVEDYTKNLYLSQDIQFNFLLTLLLQY